MCSRRPCPDPLCRTVGSTQWNSERAGFNCSTANGGRQINCSGGQLDRNGEARLAFRVKGPTTAPISVQSIELTAEVDPNRAVLDRNRANNTASLPIQLRRLPDVAVTALDGPGSLTGIGTAAAYNVTVRNLSQATAFLVIFTVRLEGVPMVFTDFEIVGDRHGLTCSIQRNGKELFCGGATLRNSQQVTVSARAITQLHKTRSTGSLRARAGSEQRDHDSTNNTREQAITVR